jgi:hypothetical protein
MFVRFGVRLLGITYLVLAVVGFLPLDLINPVHDDGTGVRYLVNLVAINAAHNVIHFALGITAILAARSLSWSRLWGKTCGPVLLVVFVAGMAQAVAEGLPPDQLLLGFVALNSPGHVLHLVTGGIALYLGLGRSVFAEGALPLPR